MYGLKAYLIDIPNKTDTLVPDEQNHASTATAGIQMFEFGWFTLYNFEYLRNLR